MNKEKQIEKSLMSLKFFFFFNLNLEIIIDLEKILIKSENVYPSTKNHWPMTKKVYFNSISIDSVEKLLDYQKSLTDDHKE